MSEEQAVLVIDGYQRRREVWVLATTRPSTIGGREADIDVGAGEVVATVVPAWRIEHRGTSEGLRHGQHLQLGLCRLQFLITRDLPRELDNQRYLETILDPLTGTFTRRFVTTHAPRIHPPAALLAIDLDRLMHTNDRYGHLIGDRVLQDTAARLRRQVHWPELVARIGGEKFLVVLPGVSRERALERAEAIRLAMVAPFEIEGERITSTVSIGLAMLAESFGEALQRADENLVTAKIEGRDRVVAT